MRIDREVLSSFDLIITTSMMQSVDSDRERGQQKLTQSREIKTSEGQRDNRGAGGTHLFVISQVDHGNHVAQRVDAATRD